MGSLFLGRNRKSAGLGLINIQKANSALPGCGKPLKIHIASNCTILVGIGDPCFAFGGTDRHEALDSEEGVIAEGVQRHQTGGTCLIMCHQITYTLPCEHVKTLLIFCNEAQVLPPFHRSPDDGGTTRPKANSEKALSGSHLERKTCKNPTRQSLPYPVPPSIGGDTTTAAASLPGPKCPLPSCPFEEKNRCWNCCWCGKSWNEKGRCSCILIVEGNEVQCEHICCSGCEAAEK